MAIRISWALACSSLDGSLLTPLAQQIGNLGTAEVDYQFNSNSTIGASTNSYISHIIKMLQPALTLVDTQSAGGGGDPVSTAPILM
jgi:hypothetical protein